MHALFLALIILPAINDLELVEADDDRQKVAHHRRPTLVRRHDEHQEMVHDLKTQQLFYLYKYNMNFFHFRNYDVSEYVNSTHGIRFVGQNFVQTF